MAYYPEGTTDADIDGTGCDAEDCERRSKTCHLEDQCDTPCHECRLDYLTWDCPHHFDRAACDEATRERNADEKYEAMRDEED